MSWWKIRKSKKFSWSQMTNLKICCSLTIKLKAKMAKTTTTSRQKLKHCWLCWTISCWGMGSLNWMFRGRRTPRTRLRAPRPTASPPQNNSFWTQLINCRITSKFCRLAKRPRSTNKSSQACPARPTGLTTREQPPHPIQCSLAINWWLNWARTLKKPPKEM